MSSHKRIKSTIMVPEDTYKETRILAIRKGIDIGSLVDEALREKIVRDYQQMGLQPPFPQTQPQSPLQHEEPVIHSARYEAAKSGEQKSQGQNQSSLQQSDEDYPVIIPAGKNQYLIKLIIPELTFPTTKQKIQQALKDGMEDLKQETHPSQQYAVRKMLYYMDRNLDIISTLLSFNKTYKDVGQIEEAIVKSSKEKLSTLHLKPEGKLIGCKISYGPDILRRQMGMELISEKDK